MSAAPAIGISYKAHFARFLGAAPGRLHFAAHSHHGWPDVTLDAQVAAWRDGIVLADHKWEKVFGEVIPAAQRHVARRIGVPDPDTVTFAPSTHDLMTRVLSCFERPGPVRIVTTGSEFHSFERQARRLEEAGRARVERVPVEPFDSFPERFVHAAGRPGVDLVYVSHVFFDSGYVLEDLAAVADALPDRGTFLVVDGYHAFMARPVDFAALHERAFFLAGGYKYAMAGEGTCFLHAPPGFGERPVITGWYAGFADLSGGVRRVSYPSGGARFLGATFDPVGIYRFNAVQEWLEREGVTVAALHERVRRLQRRFVDALPAGGPLHAGQLVPGDVQRARGNFLTFRTPDASSLEHRLRERGVVVDVRGSAVRVGFGLYHDDADVDALLGRLEGL